MERPCPRSCTWGISSHLATALRTWSLLPVLSSVKLIPNRAKGRRVRWPARAPSREGSALWPAPASLPPTKSHLVLKSWPKQADLVFAPCPSRPHLGPSQKSSLSSETLTRSPGTHSQGGRHVDSALTWLRPGPLPPHEAGHLHANRSAGDKLKTTASSYYRFTSPTRGKEGAVRAGATVPSGR